MKYSHDQMLIYTVNKERKRGSDQKTATHKPNLGLGGSLLGDQLLHTWLGALGISYMAPQGFMGTPSIIALRRGKKKKKNSKKNKMEIFMGLGGANLEISLAQIELFSRQ